MNISAIVFLLAVFTLSNINAKSTFSNQIVIATTRANLIKKWLKFKEKFGKQYHSITEDTIRRDIYISKLKQVKEHNAKYEKGQVSYKITINEFSDFKESELQSLANGIENSHNDLPFKFEPFQPPANFSAPDNFDWREFDMIPPVKSQGYCGACWAFAAVGALEAHQRIHRNNSVSLSEQNLMDCRKTSSACAGGSMEEAYRYIFENGGISTEECYPYTKDTRELKCRYDPRCRGAGIEGGVKIKTDNEEDLKLAVASQGPVVASIALCGGFWGYKEGIYHNSTCTKDLVRRHAVVVVGYGTEKGHDYWIVRNSWGLHYGDQGYIKMTRNRNNQCGIGIDTIFPKV